MLPRRDITTSGMVLFGCLIFVTFVFVSLFCSGKLDFIEGLIVFSSWAGGCLILLFPHFSRGPHRWMTFLKRTIFFNSFGFALLFAILLGPTKYAMFLFEGPSGYREGVKREMAFEFAAQSCARIVSDDRNEYSKCWDDAFDDFMSRREPGKKY